MCSFILSRVSNPNAAIFFHPDGFDTSRGKLMGRHAAGEGFLQGFARHGGVDRLYAYAETRPQFDIFCQYIKPHAGKAEPSWVPRSDPGRLREPGALFIPGPGLAEHAWLRRFRDPSGYSLTGVTHTICTDGVMDSIGELLIAPVEEWDALICTSMAVRRGVDHMHAAYGDYLARRFGTQAVAPRLQLPVIPLGVDCDRLGKEDPGGKLRKEQRRLHRIADDEVAVLFFGRLSYHAKAHPMPMYAALEEAARVTGKKIVLLQAGWFANDPIKQAFVQGARALCPSVRNEFVDGRKPDVRENLWHAADIFCSFSDNVQETFGLTPVEAMAAGLPVVASDWDGYQGTVENGVTGFLVPTAMPAPGAGEDLMYRYYTGHDTYDQYIGNVSQSVAVDTAAAARAFIDLAGNAGRRREMGERGRQRARSQFDWRVIVARYQELWMELAARRKAAAQPARAGHPLRGDPFAVFGHYTTRRLDPDTRLEPAPGDPLRTFKKVSGLRFNSFARPVLGNDAQVETILRHLQQAPGATVAALEQALPEIERALLHRTLGWLLKMDVLRIAA